jgi:hypothetical protein
MRDGNKRIRDVSMVRECGRKVKEVEVETVYFMTSD